MSPRKRDDTGLLRDRTPFEIAILAVSLLALVGLAVTLLVAETQIGSGPPDLRVTVTAAQGAPRSGGAPYEVEIRNTGGETARDVEIEIAVGDETRTLYVPTVTRGDAERATVVFPEGTTGSATAEVQAYGTGSS